MGTRDDQQCETLFKKINKKQLIKSVARSTQGAKKGETTRSPVGRLEKLLTTDSENI